MMERRTPRSRSFRLHLALRVASAFSAALLLVALAVHLGLRTILLRGMDKALSSVASIQAGAIAQSPPGDMRLHEWRLTPEEAAAVQHVNWFVEVWDSEGRPRLRSGYLDLDLPVDTEAFLQAQSGALAYATQRWEAGRLRALYYPLDRIDPRHSGHVLEVASSIAPLTQTLRRVDVVLGSALLAAVMAAFGLAWSMAGHALGPVARITDQAEKLEGGKPGQRITAHARTAEFQGLVAVLNRMLDRIDGAFEAHKRFIADASHELRSPIAALRGHLEVSRRRERSQAEYREAIDVGLDEVLRLQALAEDLLTLARRDAGVLQPRIRPLALDELVGDVAASYRALAEAREIEVKIDLVTNVVAAGDSDLLRRLVRNLLDNAIKHTPRGGEVWLRIGCDGGTGWLEVADTGPGIAPEHLPHLFERFYRADSARERSSGTGLGLAIAQAIAEAHGGWLKARNRPRGGASFRFEFLCEPDAGLTIGDGRGASRRRA